MGFGKETILSTTRFTVLARRKRPLINPTRRPADMRKRAACCFSPQNVCIFCISQKDSPDKAAKAISFNPFDRRRNPTPNHINPEKIIATCLDIRTCPPIKTVRSIFAGSTKKVQQLRIAFIN